MAKKFNAIDLANVMADKWGISVEKAYEIVCAFRDQLADAVKQRRRIEIRGFGAMRVNEVGERVTHNPKTGEVIGKRQMPPRVLFKPSSNNIKELDA